MTDTNENADLTQEQDVVAAENTTDTADKPKRKRKTPEEIMAEAEKQIARAKATIAQERAHSIPGISGLVDLMKDAKDEQNAAARKFSGPQSIDNRRQSYLLWMDEIDATEALANAEKDFYAEVHDYYSSSIADLISEVTDENGEVQVSDEDLASRVQEITDNQPTNNDLDSLREAFNNAQTARKDFTAAKKTPKRNKSEGSDVEEVTLTKDDIETLELS